MIVKLAKETVNFVLPMLNSEPIYIVIDEVVSTEDTMVVKTSMFIESNYTSDEVVSGHIIDIPTEFKFDMSETTDGHYSTVAGKLIKEYLQTRLSIANADIEILADTVWREDSAIYPTRITVPTDEIVGNYKDLINSQTAHPRYKTIDGYTLYVPGILPEHEFVRDDNNLLISDFNA